MQLGGLLGAQVTTTGREAHVDFVRSLGAHVVHDRASEAWRDERYDLVLDTSDMLRR